MTIFPEDKETETEIRGLCAAEVEERIRQGKDNRADVGTGLTTAEIIRSNTFPYLSRSKQTNNHGRTAYDSLMSGGIFPQSDIFTDHHCKYPDWDHTGDPRQANAGKDEHFKCAACDRGA